jgi:hypothetical protein
MRLRSGAAIAVKLTPAQAKALGVDTKSKRTTRKTAKAKYHTRCSCGEEFHSEAAETRHVAAGHHRFDLVFGEPCKTTKS